MSWASKRFRAPQSIITVMPHVMSVKAIQSAPIHHYGDATCHERQSDSERPNPSLRWCHMSWASKRFRAPQSIITVMPHVMSVKAIQSAPIHHYGDATCHERQSDSERPNPSLRWCHMSWASKRFRAPQSIITVMPHVMSVKAIQSAPIHHNGDATCHERQSDSERPNPSLRWCHMSWASKRFRAPQSIITVMPHVMSVKAIQSAPIHHYGDATFRERQRDSEHHPTPPFIRQIFNANIKANINASPYKPFVWQSTGKRCFPALGASDMEINSISWRHHV